ncbi:DUF6263 family protein [Bacteroidota bacterium]
MKYFLTVLLAVFLIAGCTENDNSKDVDDSAADGNIKVSEAERTALYEMTYSFAEGEKLNYRLTTITNTTQSVDSDSLIEMDVTQTIKYKFGIDVLKVDENKITTLAIRINHIDFTAVYDGKSSNYNSEMELSSEDRMEYFEYETLKHNTYHARLNNRGEILGISNLDKMIDNMAAIQGYTNEITQEERKGVSESLSSMLIKPMTQHLFRILPDSPVGVDSVWEYRYPSSLATFKIENIASFRILRIIKEDNDLAAEISASLNITHSGDNTFTEDGVSYYFDPPIVNGSGKLKFNIDKGYLIHSKTTTRAETQGIVSAKDENGITRQAGRKDITVSTNIIDRL